MENRTLVIHIDGPEVSEGKVPFWLLVKIFGGIQQTLNYVGLAEAGREVRQRARIPNDIEAACSLHRIIEQKGSYQVVAEIPLSQVPLPGMGDLGLRTLNKYKEILKRLNNESSIDDLIRDGQHRRRVLRSIASYCPSAGDEWSLTIQDTEKEISGKLTLHTRKFIDKILSLPDVQHRTVSGELIRVHLDEHKLAIYYQPTQRVLDCFYSEELEEFVIANLRGLIQVTGQVQLDSEGNPEKIVNVFKVTELDLRPFVLKRCETDDLVLRLKKPLVVKPAFDGEFIVMEIPELNIIAVGDTREEAIEELQKDLAWLWMEYIHESDDIELSEDAIELKHRLKTLMEEKEYYPELAASAGLPPPVPPTTSQIKPYLLPSRKREQRLLRILPG